MGSNQGGESNVSPTREVNFGIIVVLTGQVEGQKVRTEVVVTEGT